MWEGGGGGGWVPAKAKVKSLSIDPVFVILSASLSQKHNSIALWNRRTASFWVWTQKSLTNMISEEIVKLMISVQKSNNPWNKLGFGSDFIPFYSFGFGRVTLCFARVLSRNLPRTTHMYCIHSHPSPHSHVVSTLLVKRSSVVCSQMKARTSIILILSDINI